jgi:tetratricopeptide (TPR) repeat protein
MVSIARLSYMLEQWDTLAAIMEQQLEMSEEEQTNNLAMKLADIYQNKLDKPLEAIRVLEDMESTDPQILETIAQLYHDVGDLEHAVSLYEQLLEQSENDAKRVNLSVKIAGIYQDDLHDDAKASELLEIALRLDPDNIDVIRHQVKLCYKEGKWNRFIELNNKLMTMSDSQDEIYERTLKNAEVYERELDKGAEAMEWYIRALKYDSKNEQLLVSVERTAAEWGLWTDLFEVYQWLLQDCQDKYLEKSYYKRIVEIQETKLENKEKAMDFLNRYLLKNPGDQDMLLEAERLADEFEGGYKVLVSIYEHLIHNCFDKQKKAELLVRTAKIFSEEMDDLESALSRYERAFRANPFDSEILAKLESISRTLQKWDVYYSIQGVVLKKMDDPLEKVDEIFKLAKIIEKEAGDLVKAFRVYLHAFMLEPKNEEITDNLWRLAEKTGSYTPEQKEISPLEISPILKKGLALYHRGYEKYQEDLAKAPKKRRPEVTQELDFDDLEIVEEEDDEELEEEDVFKVEYTAPTSGLSMQDLIEAKRGETGNFSEVEMSEVIEEYESDIQASKDSLIVPIGSDSKTAQLPAPESPWEEMVRAYAMLSHPDAITKVNHLRKIARIWQEGADNKQKAYKALVRAFSLIPEDTEIQELLENLAREMEIVKNCADTYFKIARESVKRETSLFLFKRTSELYKEVENMEGMEESLRAILAVDQENELAYKRIKELLTKKEEWQELVSFLEWKLELEIDSLSLDEKLEYFKNIAELYEEKLEDYEQALAWRSYYLDKEPDNVDALQASLRLSCSIKTWPKATEVLRKLVDLEDNEKTQLQRLHELADITLQKLELPDQAINIYREILGISENDQVALDKLDQLYLEHELWTNLEEILYRKIENEKEAEKENKLKHRYGEILKKLNRNSEAAAVYNDLWEETGNSRYAIKASEMYMEIDQPSQGVSILEGLLNSEQDEFADREKASMWVQMAAIQRRSLNEQVKAQVSLQKAMELDPNNPDAFLELANLAKKREDWGEYARLQRKIGENTEEPSARDAALYISATTYRNKLNELETAEEVLRQLIAKNNTYLDALNTLFELYTETEDWSRASRVLDRLIQLAEDLGSHKAYLLAKQGDIYLKQFDDEDTAYKLLSEALEIDDNNVDAILTLSELAEKREELEHASNLLEDALKKLKDEPEKVAKLGRRYAQLMSKQDKAENAVTLLKELDRKYSDQLLIKLTLGEIRFKSGRWRETTKLLADIGDHPDAPEYSREVARALCMAAESEIKQRRRGATPNKLWERAVQLQPDYLPAIEALIEYHLDNGDKHEAAEYLKAQALAADKPESKITLFKSLGELYIEQLDNKKEAFYCFLNAYNEREKMERNDEDINLLKRLVELSGHLDKDNEIINAVHILYEKGEYESELDLLLRLGKVYLDKQDTDNAVEYLEKAQKKAPANESVLDNLSQLYHIIGRYEDAAHLIEMLLERKSSGEMKNLDYRLKLMNRLGDIYCQMEEGKEKAVDCIEESLKLDSEQPEQRKKLISLYGDDDKYTEEKIRQQEIYLQSNPLEMQYIENLADWYEAEGNDEKSFLYFQFLNLFDQLSPERVQWLHDRMQDIEQVEVKYSGSLSDEDRKLLAEGAISESMEDVFNVLWEAAPILFKKNLSSLGLSKDDKVSPVDKSNLAVVFSEIAKVTGSRSTRLYLADSDIVQGVRVAPHAPPLIMLDHETADNLPGTLRFLISRALQLAKPKFILAAGYFPEEFSVFFSALIRAFHPKYKKRQFKLVDPIDVKAKQLKEQLPYRISKNIVEIFKNQETSSFNSGRWRRNAWMVGNRIGLLTTGDLYETLRIVVYEEVEKVLELPLELDVIMELAAKNESIKDIFQFYFGEVYLQMRKKIGMTPQD